MTSTRETAYDRPDRGGILAVKMSEAVVRDLKRLVDGPCESIDDAEFLSERARARLQRIAVLLANEEERWIGRA